MWRVRDGEDIRPPGSPNDMSYDGSSGFVSLSPYLPWCPSVAGGVVHALQGVVPGASTDVDTPGSSMRQTSMLSRLLDDVLRTGTVSPSTLTSVLEEATARFEFSPLKPGGYACVLGGRPQDIEFHPWVKAEEVQRIRAAATKATSAWSAFVAEIKAVMKRAQSETLRHGRKARRVYTRASRDAEVTASSILELRVSTAAVVCTPRIDRCVHVGCTGVGQGTVADPGSCLRYRSNSPEDHPLFVTWVAGILPGWDVKRHADAVGTRLREMVRLSIICTPGLCALFQPDCVAHGSAGGFDVISDIVSARAGCSVLDVVAHARYRSEERLYRALHFRLFNGGRKYMRWGILDTLSRVYADGVSYEEFCARCFVQANPRGPVSVIDKGWEYKPSRTLTKCSFAEVVACYTYLRLRRERRSYGTYAGSVELWRSHQNALLAKCGWGEPVCQGGASQHAPISGVGVLPPTAGVVPVCLTCRRCAVPIVCISEEAFIPEGSGSDGTDDKRRKARKAKFGTHTDIIQSLYSIGLVSTSKQTCGRCLGGSRYATTPSCPTCRDFGHAYHCYRTKKRDPIREAVKKEKRHGDCDDIYGEDTDWQARVSYNGSVYAMPAGSVETLYAKWDTTTSMESDPVRRTQSLVRALNRLDTPAAKTFVSSGDDVCRHRPMVLLEAVGVYVMMEGRLHAMCCREGCGTLSVVRDECFVGSSFECRWCTDLGMRMLCMEDESVDDVDAYIGAEEDEDGDDTEGEDESDRSSGAEDEDDDMR